MFVSGLILNIHSSTSDVAGIDGGFNCDVGGPSTSERPAPDDWLKSFAVEHGAAIIYNSTWNALPLVKICRAHHPFIEDLDVVATIDQGMCRWQLGHGLA